ncbi:hypothetical protein BsWGS_21759 [Bradybaena similaris]
MAVPGAPKKPKTGKEEKGPVKLIKTPVDLQRLKLEKLMKNPNKEIIIPEKSKEKSLRPPLEFIRNIWGSSAGAGSGDFHVYRGVRRREYARQKFIKEKAEKEEQDAEYKKKLEQHKKEAEERAAKNRAKRLKKKQKLKAKKLKKNKGDAGKKTSSGDDVESGSSADEQEKPSSQAEDEEEISAKGPTAVSEDSD